MIKTYYVLKYVLALQFKSTNGMFNYSFKLNHLIKNMHRNISVYATKLNSTRKNAKTSA